LRSSVYIQEGQGVNHGYLLLGVYDRRTPSFTVILYTDSFLTFQKCFCTIAICSVQ
jgi:hypothetical protein